jgi:uncharacterized protein (DUF1501 family)
MMIGKRRDLLKGCCVATTEIAGTGTRLGFATTGDSKNVIVYLLLRGGIDGLSLIPPIDGADRDHYEHYRPKIQVPLGGKQAALALDGRFGLHPAATALKALYDDDHLAVVQAVGILPVSVASRSHCIAQRFLECGMAGDSGSHSGWLARYLATAPDLNDRALLTAITAGAQASLSLRGDADAATIVDGSHNFAPNSHWRWRDAHLSYLNMMYRGQASLDSAVRSVLNTVDVFDSLDFTIPPAGGARYPSVGPGCDLKLIAQVIKQNIGLRVATIDDGGWDTHNDQGNQGGGFFAGKVNILAEAIYAFFIDLEASGYRDYLTLVIHSEFGRRVRQNNNHGTDHGSGNPLIVVDAGVNGGHIHGDFPGLAGEQLFDNADVAVTTDFRTVLSEIVSLRLGNPHIDQVFPGFSNDMRLGLYPQPPLSRSDSTV